MTVLRRAAAGTLLVTLVALAAGTVRASPPPLTVYVSGSDTRTSLRLQPGFATVVRADHRIDAVAIGDPRLVTATPVKHGQDVFDVILQPQVNAGVTNMVVWFGDVTSVWDLTIAAGPRTADVVYVVTRSGSAAGSAPPARASAPAPTRPGPAASPSQPSAGQGTAARAAIATPSSPHQAAPTNASAHPDAASGGPAAPSSLEVTQTVGPIAAVFDVTRTTEGVSIRYRLTNNGDGDVAIRPVGVLVRVNGTLVPFAMARGSVDRTHPELLPHGATENGVIDASVRTARSVQVTLSLFPLTSGDHPAAAVPFTFEPLFSDVNRLAATAP